MAGAITDVAGVLVGHAHDAVRGSGVTVLHFPEGAAGGADIRGEAAGTRQMDSLLRTHPARKIDAVVFSGGSAFGLDAASGVVRYLEERYAGFPTPGGMVPIVPTAILYDLGYGDASFRPDARMGYEAIRNASSLPPRRGSVGAGAGATVGKALGIRRAMKGGFGTASESGGGTVVGACAVVNAFGDVIDSATGEWVAGARAEGAEAPADTDALFRSGFRREPFSSENTTLAVVATGDALSREELRSVARMSHAALCRAIRPVHTPMDGDIVVAVATGLSGKRGNVLQTAALGGRALEAAILDGVRSAKGTTAVPAAAEIPGRRGWRL
ncbi:MAG: peptidase S58 family protein [Deltaproteobacteria bacterium]|nr:MAG: peptidase S58 family protein [Deltaproteobacteria bacterium]